MKKKILGLALIAMTLTAFSGMAQTPADNATPAKQECVKGKKAAKQDCSSQLCPFAGMNLTDAQKTQLQQLDSKRKAARQARNEKKQEMNNDRLAERQADKKAYLEEVKAIIGPDNYVVFLENFYVNGGRHDGKSAIRQTKGCKDQANPQGRGARDDKRGHHSSRRNVNTNNSNATSSNS